MPDTTVKKVSSSHSPTGEMGQIYLASGKSVALRLWHEKPADTEDKAEHARPYETVGYVIEGEAELYLEGQTVSLKAGDSWLVPAGARHRYSVRSAFKAVEATSPPAHAHGRDDAPA